MDMKCSSNPYASSRGQGDDPQRKGARREGTPPPVLQELECPVCLRLCSRVKERLGGQRLQALAGVGRAMCAECGERVSQVRCSTCGTDLCTECDQKIHSFRATGGHTRETLSVVSEYTGNIPPSGDASGEAPGALSPAPAGSASQDPVLLYCHGAAHRNPLSSSSGPDSLALSGVPTLSGLVSPASDPQFGRPVATHYCVDTGELLCPECATSPFYSGKRILTVDEGASMCAAQVRDASARARGLASSVREHLLHLRGLRECSASYLTSALSELQTLRRAVLAAVDQRFDEIDAQLSQLAQKRADAITTLENKDSAEVQAAVDCALACEKHVAQRQAGVLLLEYPAMHGDLQDAVARLAAFVADTCPREPRGSPDRGDPGRGSTRTILPRVCPYPRLLPVVDLVDLLDERLRFRQDDLLAEEANHGLVFSGRQGPPPETVSPTRTAGRDPRSPSQGGRLGCKKCGAPLLNLRNREALETAAEHRRGALCGIRPELAVPGSLILDSQGGEPSARPLRCKKCSCELGRWAEEGSGGRGYQPSYLYVSTNSVAPCAEGA